MFSMLYMIIPRVQEIFLAHLPGPGTARTFPGAGSFTGDCYNA
jgi:hypothetical protein